MARGKASRLQRTVVADRLDLRDRSYMPDVSKAPPARLLPDRRPPSPLTPLDQGETSACTGFALARVIDHLLHRSERKEYPVSPFMLYSMARRYDEFAWVNEDKGSSLRGALKGWFKHGACSQERWKTMKMPPAARKAADDWWQDSARRPLGAYYRIDTRSLTDMHLALRDVGAIYASAICHGGWNSGFSLPKAKREGWRIPYQEALPGDGGHAFIIVGYDEHGFIVLNSWGTTWGDAGLATLSYRDWLDHAMDCWVAQLGVVTDQHQAVAEAVTLRQRGRTVELAADRNLRNQEISPFIVDMENNGKLSERGDFRTSKEDLKALVSIHLDAARSRWKKEQDVVDVAIYAHGGLTGEATAADTAARWIPALYEAQIFPIFLMWETDLWSTLKNRFQDLMREMVAPTERATAGIRDQLQRFLNKRIEQTVQGPGSAIWGEMKQNAEAISTSRASGGQMLYTVGTETGAFERGKVRLHLIGHSAGAIVHSHIVKVLSELGWRFATVTFMAPAVTCAVFEDTVLPALKRGKVGAYHQYHLKTEAEERDTTCRPILGYGRSLLYLVSESFEGGRTTPILGLERDFRYGDLEGVRSWTTPSGLAANSTHGGFDDDADVMAAVIRRIKESVQQQIVTAAGRSRRVRRAARRNR